MLVHRFRRWSNTVPTLAERLVFAGGAMPACHLAYYVVMIPFLSKSDAAREITLSYHDHTFTLSLPLTRFKLLKQQIKLYMATTLIHLIFVLYNNALTLANMSTYDHLICSESDQVSVIVGSFFCFTYYKNLADQMCCLAQRECSQGK